MKKNTSVPGKWIAGRLQMGHLSTAPVAISRFAKDNYSIFNFPSIFLSKECEYLMKKEVIVISVVLLSTMIIDHECPVISPTASTA